MSDCNGVDTPSTTTPSGIDFDGDPFTETWQYNSIIGMLMYLSANTRPDIAYAVHQAARFSHAPRHSHAIAVRRFLRYLQKTKTMGLLLKPTNTQRVDCYVDADFAGLLLLKIIKIPFQSSPVLAMLCCTKKALFSGYPRCRLRLP